jgi:SNF2 family DNA or RNA helicase
MHISSPIKPIKPISLLSHQKEAVQYMNALENNSNMFGIRGGILADHMGLGKTYSIMGLCASSMHTHNLIIVPLAMVSTWIDTFIQYNFSVYSIHSKRGSGFIKHSNGARSVYIIHYNAVISKYKLLLDSHWSRIIIDEAHNIRNIKSQLFVHLNSLSSSYKWAITATPIINGISDAINIFEWLGYKHKGSISAFLDLYKGGGALAPFIIKRTVADIPSLSGNIASFTETTIHIPLNSIESSIYNHILSNSALSPSAINNLSPYNHLHSIDSDSDSDSDSDQYQDSIDSQESALESQESALESQESALESQESGIQLPKGYSALKSLHLLHLLSIHPKLIDPSCSINDSNKFIRAKEVLLDMKESGKSSIVFCQFNKEIQLLRDYISLSGICSLEDIYVINGGISEEKRRSVLEVMKKRVEAGKFIVLLLQIRSGACGLNLQYFSSVLFLNLWWNRPIIDQAIGRVVRLGSSGIKSIFYFQGERGYDRFVASVLSNKTFIVQN